MKRINYTKLCLAELGRLNCPYAVMTIPQSQGGGVFLDDPWNKRMRKFGSTQELLAELKNCVTVTDAVKLLAGGQS